MPDVAELGRKVKAKYPGAYDDLPDVEVGRKVKAKYPGAYDDFTDVPGGSGFFSEVLGRLRAALKAVSQKTTPAAVKGFDYSNKAREEAEYQARNKFGDPRSEGLEGVPLPPTNQIEAAQQIRGKTTKQVLKGAQAFSSAVGGAAQFGAALATGGASSLGSVALEGFVNTLFGPPGEADAAFALLPSVLRGSKAFMSAVRSKDAEKVRKFVSEARMTIAEKNALENFGAKDPTATFRPKGVSNEAIREVGGHSEPRLPGGTPPAEKSMEPKSKGVEVRQETPIDPHKQGVSHSEIDGLRKDLGWEPRKRDPKTDAQMIADSKIVEGKESVIANRITSDPDGVETLAEHEALAVGKRLKTLRDEMRLAKNTDDGAKYDILDTEAQQLANALDVSGSRQGRAFRARQFLYNEMDEWTIERSVRKANGGVDLTGKRLAEQDKIIDGLSKTIATLSKELDQARKDAFAWVSSKAKSKASTGPKIGETRRSDALARLKRLGVPVAEEGELLSGGMKSKQSGAIHIPQGSTEQVAMAVRGLTKSYGELGAKNWDDVFARLEKDLPGIEEEQALFILSGKYKAAKIEADVAKRNANQFLSRVKADAMARQKPIVAKALSLGMDVLNTSQRSLQTTLDDSMALIQGKNVLTWKPGTWIKGVGNGLAAGFRANPIDYAERHLVNIQNDPLYSRAVQAKLALSDVKGSFQGQEETVAGLLENKIPGLANSKAMATVTMNQMRFDLFRKLAAAGPDNADYLEDIARIINVATGKGDGKLAQWIGGKEGGMVFYAPRYYVSKWQHNFGQPLWKAKTAEGMREAGKMYGSQLAGYGILLKTVQELGFEVELDPRSANFGRASNGQWSFDLFNQQSEGLRVAAQLAYGRISKKGEYKDPGEFGAYDLETYIGSKFSAGIKSGRQIVEGKRYDDEAGGYVDATYRDFWRNYIPISVQEAKKMGWKPGMMGGSFFGGNLDKPFNPKSGVPKLEPLPPGVKRWLGR